MIYFVDFVEHSEDIDFGYASYKDGEYTLEEMEVTRREIHSIEELLVLLERREFSFDYDASKAEGIIVRDEHGKIIYQL